MKTPSWSLTIGIIMLFFGGCSSVNSIQKIGTPQVIELQKKMVNDLDPNNDNLTFDNISVQLDSLDSTNQQEEVIVKEIFTDIFNMSDENLKWIIRFGYIGLFVSIIYILGGVFMLISKPFSIKLALSALALSIIFRISEAVVFSLGFNSSILIWSNNIGHAFSVLIDVILIIVILNSDKTFYKQHIE